MFKAALGLAVAATAAALSAAPAAAEAPPPFWRPRVMIALAPKVISVDWERVPSRNEIDRMSPSSARRRRLDGRAVLSCRVNASGYLNACAVAQVEPKGVGFDGAALRLAPYFKLQSRMSDGRPMQPGEISVPISFGDPPS